MSNFRWTERIDPFAVLAFTVPLTIYLLTLAPSVTFFDSGEFLTAIFSLGTAHSPGYPLFVNYAKPFTYLPFGSIAFRVNFATAVSAAAACYGVYLIVCHLLAGEELAANTRQSEIYKKIIALCAATSFAFSARLWLQSNHDKPYPLIAFLSAMVFYLLLLWRDRYRQGEEHSAYIYLGAFLCGLAFGAHQTIVLLLPSYAFLILSMNWRLIWRIKEFILALFFGVLGFAVHLHLPVRAMQNPLLNWGDSKTLTQFLWNLLRRGYPSEKPVRDLSLLWDQINAFNIPYEFTWVGLVLVLIGVFAFLKKRRDEILAYLIGILFFLLVIAGYFNTPLEMIFLTEEFFTPLYLLSAVIIGLGLFALVQNTLALIPSQIVSTLPVKTAVTLFLLAFPATVCALHYVENDQHENYIAYDYASNTLRSLPQGAILFTWGDSGAFPLWYLQGVEKMREDLDLPHTPHLVFNWYLDTFPQLFRHSMLRSIPLESQAPENALQLVIVEQYDRRPVFVDFSTRYSIEFPDYRLLQRGICYQLIRGKGEELYPDLTVWDNYILRGISGEMFFRDLDTGKAILIYANSHLESGETLLRMRQLGQGVAELRAAERIAPQMQMQVAQILSGYGIR
ncbi:protein O-mannosyl-transferase family [Geotalea toluenoxydans]